MESNLVKFDIFTSRKCVRELDCSIMAIGSQEAAKEWYARTPVDKHCGIIVTRVDMIPDSHTSGWIKA